MKHVSDKGHLPDVSVIPTDYALARTDLDGTCRDKDCDTPHCQACSRRHVVTAVACRSCLHQAEELLDEQLDLESRLLDQALNGSTKTGRSLAGQHLPGGVPMLMLFPHADPEAREHMISSLETGRIVGDVTDGMDQTETPAEFRASWARQVRDFFGIAACADRDGDELSWTDEDDIRLLTKAMPWAASKWAGFPSLVAGLHDQVRMLQQLTGAGEARDVSGVPCPDCSTMLHVVVGSTETTDELVCPRPLCDYSMRAIHAERHVHERIYSDEPEVAQAWVQLSDAAASTGRSAQSIHTWIRNGVVESRLDPRSGTRQVAWLDVIREHETRQERARAKKGQLAQVIPLPTRPAAEEIRTEVG